MRLLFPPDERFKIGMTLFTAEFEQRHWLGYLEYPDLEYPVCSGDAVP